MTFCAAHWEQLKQKIKDVGLYSYVSHSGEEAKERMLNDAFEPLMSAVNAIYGNAMSIFGLTIIGAGCPICYGNNQLAEHQKTCKECKEEPVPYEIWFDYAVAEQLDEANKLGLHLDSGALKQDTK